MGTRAWGRRALPVASPLTRDVSTALVTGELGALLACAVLMVISAVDRDRGPLYPLQLMGAFVAGEAALAPGNVLAAAVGIVFVLAIPAFAWSVVFGLCANLARARCGRALTMLVVGLTAVSAAVDLLVVGPSWLRGLTGRDLWYDRVPVVWGVLWHVVFGVVFLAFPALYAILWGARAHNVYRMRRFDPIDPLGM